MVPTTGEKGRLERALAKLKQRGSNLLVVGSPVDTARQSVSRRLLGDGVRETRRRLFVFTDAAYADTRLGTGPLTPETVRVIDQRTPTRSAATPQPAVTLSGAPTATRRQVDSGRLGSLSWAIEEEVEALERHANGLSAGELRLCFDSLGPALSTHDVDAVRRFARTVGNRVKASSGMAHYHLPVSRSDSIVEELRPVFDAVIELRARDGFPEHRWVLSGDYESDWLPL